MHPGGALGSLRFPLTFNARVCSADINDTLELGGSHPLASDVEMARLLDACNAARSLPVRSSAGGSASNVLRAVASFGASARLVGARGDDADGELYERSIRDAGICADHLVVQPNRKTASCAVVSERAGMQRTMRTLFVDAARLDVGELREELLAASFCFVSSYTCYFEGMIERLIELAEAAGCSILLDLGSFEIVKRWVLISTDDEGGTVAALPPSPLLTRSLALRASLGRSVAYSPGSRGGSTGCFAGWIIACATRTRRRRSPRSISQAVAATVVATTTTRTATTGCLMPQRRGCWTTASNRR